MMARIAYQALEASTVVQKVTLTSSNRCFTFGGSNASIEISYTISGEVANIDAVKLTEKFAYVPNSPTDDVNQITI